ncbi:amidohydrolase family protein [Pseudonocardia yunnanensis]|uniref:Amidohydrolase family protein n=1 Tax=Pseudonocardia yunnanensis TaxID=58107 RepID=A0ABW4F3V4_9PSEU
MRTIAVEEAFRLPQLATQVTSWSNSVLRADRAREWARRLPEFDELRLAEMDEHGVDLAVLSLTAPGIQVQPDAAVAVDDARIANDALAEIVAKRPDRYAGLAALPLQDPDAAAAELVRSVRTLGLCGALVNGPTLGHYLDEPRFQVVWAALEELDAPLYLHPTSVPAGEWHVLGGRPELAGPSFSWAAETGGHALRIIYGGVFDDHPGATLVLGHMGEFLPFQLARLDASYAITEPLRTLAKSPSQYVRENVVIATSGVCSHAALLGAVLEIGVDHVMFAIDYPYESTADAVRFLRSAPFSETDLARISHRNAERVFRLDSVVKPRP